MSKRTAPPPPDASAAGAAAAPDVAAVRKRLLALGYRELFLRADTAEVDTLAADAPALEALVRAPDENAQARFLAAEILFLRAPGFPPAELKAPLAALYAQALAQTSRETGTWKLMANQWGMLYDGNDAGLVGGHLLALGAEAVPALRGLLDDREHVLYEGSRNATTGNDRMYRIKDVAAWYLGRLTGKPVPYHVDLAARDREIAKLVKALP
ncbi:MAG TPA: hypothetical protein VHE35_26195 [Kofleriaceae bacterium]|nr:hypothetical protein [Kofleriaceae bacterium]